jgi:hypothetical protein
VHALLTQERGPIVFTQTYGYKLDYTFSPATNILEGHHFELQWARGVGGTNTQASWTLDADGNVSSNLFIAVWPPDNGYWPILEAATWSGSYSNGVLTASARGEWRRAADAAYANRAPSRRPLHCAR